MLLPLQSFCLLAFTIISIISQLNAADLHNDLRDFMPLIPRRRIGFIAARHYILDEQFRHAFDYMHTDANFQINWQKIRDTKEFQQIIEYVKASSGGHAASNMTSIIDSIPVRLRSFQLPDKIPMSVLMERNLSNFLKEVVRSLPRIRISSLIAKKHTENGDFAKLHKALKEPEFRRLVDEAKQSASLAEPLQQYRNNFIDVDEIIKIGFNLLKW